MTHEPLPMIRIENITVSRGGEPVINDISCSFESGQLIGLVGPNGAGKSTLLSTLAGLIAPDRGAIRYSGEIRTISEIPPQERARHLGYLPQDRIVHWPMPVIDIVRLGRFAFGGPVTNGPMPNAPKTSAPKTGSEELLVQDAMTCTGILDFAERPINSLSGGEQSRVHLARLLAGNAPVFLADEPTNALDPHHQFAMMQALRTSADQGKLVIAALHDLPLAARLCDQLVILHKGKQAALGPPRDVLTPLMLRDVFNIDGSFVDMAESGKTLIIHPYTSD